jgi:hypothetical protein
MPEVLDLILSHQAPAEVRLLVDYWRSLGLDRTLLLAYGGSVNDFDAIASEPKLFISDQRLRTRDHQRELQSYTNLFRAAANWMKQSSVEFVHFVEYDHLPLVSDLHDRQLALMNGEKADVLGFHLARVDDTSNPHYLYYLSSAPLADFFRQNTCRSDPNVVLSMLATGSFWTRDAFEAVAKFDEPYPIYAEIYLPTLAHHLGFRVRDYGEQNAFVSHQGDFSAKINAARAKGAWTLHPVKKLPPLLSPSPHH